MTAPTETGHIVAYLSLDDTEWHRSIERAKRELASLRSERDVDLRVRVDDNGALAHLAAIREELRGIGGTSTTSVNVRTNANRASSEIRGMRSQVSLLMDAILLLGSAAVPVAGVAGGALVGLVPTIAATAFGIAGIRDEMKSGALEGTQYAGDISRLKSELIDLKAVTAGGLLDGLHDAMADADPLFRVVNTDAQLMSQQIGQIGSNVLPGVLTLLTQMNPLFQTFGDELVRGSEGFERWTRSTSGVTGFVNYVQSELPAVEHTLGSLLELISHIGQGLGPLGHLTLTSIGVLADTINQIPIGVLQAALPLIVATRVAMLGYRGISAVMTGVSGAYTRAAGTAQVFGSTTMAANLQAQASAAATAEVTAVAANETAQGHLRTALAAVTAAEEQVAAAALIGEAAIAEARTVVATKQAEAEAAAAAAAVTNAAALKASAAAEMNALRTLAAGRVAATGWRAALGPIGALVIGLSVLATAFGGSEDKTNDAAHANENYTESVKQSTDAMSRANVQATIKTLSDGKQFSALRDLRKGNSDLTVTTNDLTEAVNGNQSAYDDVIDKLHAYADAHRKTEVVNANAGTTKQVYTEEGKAALKLADDLGTTRKTLLENIDAQKQLEAAQRSMIQQYYGGATAVGQQARALGMTSEAYLDAAASARQSTAQTEAQTRAMQLQNDAMGLLSQAFDKLNGKTLDISDARLNFASSLANLNAGLKENAKAWNENTEAGRTNQQNVNQTIRNAQNVGKAVSGGTQLTKDGVKAAREMLLQERKVLVARGASAGAIKRVDQALRGLANVKVPKVNIETGTAKAKIAELRDKIRGVKQEKVPGISANTAAGRALLARYQEQIDAIKQNRKPRLDVLTADAWTAAQALQAYIDGMRGKTLRVNVEQATTGTDAQKDYDARTRDKHSARGGPVRRAAGGPVAGPGTGTSDEVPAVLPNGTHPIRYWLSNGEWIATADATRRNRGALAAANRGATLAVVHKLATGGPVGGITSKGSGKSATYSYGGTKYDTLDQATKARNTDIRARLHLIATIDGSGLRKFSNELDGTLSDAKAAFHDLYKSVSDAGFSDRLLANLRAANASLDKTIAHRDRLRARLGTRTDNSTTAYERLENIRSARSQMASSVRSTAAGAFDLANSGEQIEGQAPTGASMQANALQAANLIERFYSGIRKLSGTTLGKSTTGRAMLRRLEQAGPDAYPQVQALLRDTPKQLTSLVATQKRIDTASANLGSFTATQAYGARQTAAEASVRSLRSQVAADDRRAERQGRVIAREVRAGIRNLRIDLDGKRVNKGSRAGGKKNDRRR